MNDFFGNLVRVFGRRGDARPGGRRSAPRRRLVIESMESRTMLSATGLSAAGAEFGPVELPFAKHVDFSIERPIIARVNLDQGGFLSIQSLVDAQATGGANGFPMSDVVGDRRLSVSISGQNISGQSGISINFLDLDSVPRGAELGISGNDYSFDGDLYGNNLPPAVIGPEQPASANGDTNLSSGPSTLEITPVPIDPVQGPRGEGGSVSITAISTALKSPSELNAPAPAIASVGVGSDQTTALLAARAMSMDAISGEWARAIAFETVSDEPVERNPPGDRADLSSLLQEKITDRLVLPRDASTTTERTATHDEPTEDHKVSANEPAEEHAVQLMQFAGALVGPWMTVPLLAPLGMISEMVANEPAEAPAPNQQASTAALAEAFADLASEGVNEAQATAASRQYDVWNLTPLLMMLALERLASNRSQHAELRTRASSARPLLKS